MTAPQSKAHPVELYNVLLKSPEDIERDTELQMAYQRGYESGCASHTSSAQEREYCIDFDENGGEYTGHLRILTSENLSIVGEKVLKIGSHTVIEIDEIITAADEWTSETDFHDVLALLQAGEQK